MRNPKTAFMARQERMMDEQRTRNDSKTINWHDEDLMQFIRDGEVAYNPDTFRFYDPQHADLIIEDFSQRKLARWRRERRIVVEGRVVRIAT